MAVMDRKPARNLLRSASVRKFIRFLFVGGINTVVGYGLFAVLVYAGLQPELALAIATVLGVLFNYLTTGALVFQNRDHSRILRFIAVYGVIYLLNAGALRSLLYAGLSPLLAQLFLVPVVAVATFFALRSFVFREEAL
jgi:putative flippase GtrA